MTEMQEPMSSTGCFQYRSNEIETGIGVLFNIYDHKHPGSKLTHFYIPGGKIPRVRHAYTLKIVSPVPRPNWWFRLWSRLFLGWRWEIEKPSQKGPEQCE